MTSMTVKEFALELKLPVKTLLAQLRAAGVSKDAENDVLSDADKSRLLDSLRIERTQTSQRKITINRKEKSVIKQTDASGRAHTIQVEVRKKRVFMKNPQIQAEEEAKIEQAAREEAARREAEAKRQAEEEARRKAEEERRAAEEAARREREEAERRAAAERTAADSCPSTYSLRRKTPRPLCAGYGCSPRIRPSPCGWRAAPSVSEIS